MPAPLNPAEFFIGAAERGLSPTATLREFRAAGGSIRTQTAYRLYGEAQRAISQGAAEPGRPLNRRPTADEIAPRTTIRGEGLIQRVHVLVRDRTTGLIRTQPISMKFGDLRSRQHAITAATNAAVEGGKKYNEQVLGAYYAGTFDQTPVGDEL